MLHSDCCNGDLVFIVAIRNKQERGGFSASKGKERRNCADHHPEIFPPRFHYGNSPQPGVAMLGQKVATGSNSSATKLDKLQRRFATFVNWIATQTDRENDLRERAAKIRTAICEKAKEDGITIRSTPDSGSFATRTGLRRHMLGQSEVEGQDVDLPFVVAPKTKDEERLDVLLPHFEKYAREAYPDTEIEMTKSSVKLKFSDKVSFDLVPLFSTKDPDRQILVRTDGERRETSVQKHVVFVRSRINKSQKEPGRVEFNEITRLFKWWRYFRQEDSGAIKEIPSFMINLLSACAFDNRGVQATYGETIADWFGFLARMARKRTPISFSDFAPILPPAQGITWSIKDPVNPDNNIVEGWNGIMCDEFAEWLEESRDAMYEAIAAFEDSRENDGVECLVRIFGTPFKHHSESKP